MVRGGSRTAATFIEENLQVLFCRITYAGTQTYILFMNSTKNLKRVINKPFILKNIYKTTKISIYFNTKYISFKIKFDIQI